MNVWRIGSNWGKTNLLPIFKKEKLAFAGLEVEDKVNYVQPGDVLCITNGQSIEGLGTVAGLGALSESNPDHADEFDPVTAIKLASVIWKDDYPQFEFGTYDGMGKQFHKAGDDYDRYIKKIYSKIKIEAEKQQILDLLRYKKQIILQGPPGTGKTRAAKELALEMLGLHDEKELENNEQFKIVQFHPSYTYEDFVRGIEAQANGEVIEYKSVDKALGVFAKEALDNYRLSQIDNKEASLSKWIEERFEEFKTEIELEIGEKGEKYLSGNIGIFKVEGNNFRYGKEWGSASRINYNDFKNLIRSVVKKTYNPSSPQIPKEISLHAHYRHTYYRALLNEFFKANKFENETVKQDTKNFVLIIDEINRANLSSVLGELIYALEYRGEALDGMYEIDGGRQLILPPNLYIIGTMNTADRSVGHIDYAIRRRFAFMNVPPQRLMENDEIWFNADGFDKVALLFNDKNVSPEFESKDVQIGHSYFIVPKKDAADAVVRDALFQMKMNYEVVPILLEYIRDGILVGMVNGEDIKTYVEGLRL